MKPSRLDTLRAQLAIIVNGEIDLFRAFVELLDREQVMLINGETDALIALTRDKTELYHGLQRHADNRAQLLGRAGLGNSDEAVRAVFQGLPETLGRWDELLSLAADAQARNAINGKLITERMQHNQAALSVLLAAADQPQLYDAGGHARLAGRGRHLGSA